MENTETTVIISIRPSAEISDKILEVKKETDVYYPDHEDSLPHITLYTCKLEEGKYEEVISVLKNLRISPVEFTLSSLQFSEMTARNYTFTAFDVAEKEKLQNIHEIVLGVVNPIRGDLVRHKDIERHRNGKMTDEEFAFTKEYGFLYFMEKYNPHITIGVIPIGDQVKEDILKQKLGDLAGKKFIADKIFVKFKKRTIPDERVIFESDTIEIPLN